MSNSALQAAALYVGLGAGILIWMAARVISLRGVHKVSVGDGGEPRLIRAMRGQANFVEYAPMMYVLLVVMALMGAPAWVVHVFGIAFTIARVMHAVHFMAADAPGWQRLYGTVITFTCLGVAGAGAALHALFSIASGGV